MKQMKIRMLSDFTKWLEKQNNQVLYMKVLKRLSDIKHGNFGDFKSLGDGVSEIRINYGAGYRIYYTLRGSEVVILLCGGSKSTQKRDIEKAKKLLKEVIL